MKNTLLSTLIVGAATLLVSSDSLFASTEKATRAIALELGLESEAVSYEDTGYGPDNIGANNGVFDWDDANGNGVLDVNEPSEPLTFTVSCTEGFVEAIRRAAEKYPNLAFDIAEIVVEFSGGMTDPECVSQIALAIIQGANLGGDAVSVVVATFVAAFPEGEESAAADFFQIVTVNFPLPDSSGPDSQPQPGPDDVPPSTPAPFPDSSGPDSQPQPGPDDLPPSTPAPQPSFSPTPTPAPAPTPVQPSPTPVTPFQNL